MTLHQTTERKSRFRILPVLVQLAAGMALVMPVSAATITNSHREQGDGAGCDPDFSITIPAAVAPGVADIPILGEWALALLAWLIGVLAMRSPSARAELRAGNSSMSSVSFGWRYLVLTQH